MSTNLHVLLAGPFVFRSDPDDDFLRVLVPDLMDTHFKPGFTATHNSAELENGIWTLDLGKRKSASPKWPLKPKGDPFFPFDEFTCSRPSCSRAYAVLRLPKPQDMLGLSPTSVEITSPAASEQADRVRKGNFATRAVLVYESVELDQLTITPHMLWNPSGMGNQPVVRAVGSAGVGLVVLDMRPMVVPTDDEHAKMAYRNMAGMVGVDRYMAQQTGGDFNIFKGKYNDCGAALMLVSAKK
jgi:hypothetical protein